MKKQPSAKTGQSLTEYAVIGALVGIAGIVALVVMGNTLNNTFGNMLGKNAQNLAGTGKAPVPVIGATSGYTVLTANGGAAITLSDGTVLNLSNYLGDPAATVQTAGANGTTDILASSLSEIANQLLAQGKITATQANWLQKLANEGHLIADSEKLAADAFASGTTALLPQGMSDHDAVFSQLKTNALSTPLDPAAEALVSQLADQILAMSQSTQTAVATALSNWTSTGVSQSTMQQIAQDYQVDTISAVTHVHSAVICGTGGNTDSGTYCTAK